MAVAVSAVQQAISGLFKAHSAESERSFADARWPHAAAILAILAWAVLSWTVLRPGSIALDYQSIRQADTQTIARHFTEPEANLFYPRVDWGGDGPGFVETELQIYTGLISLVLRVFGDVEWPGQLISLVASSLSGYVLFRGLSERLGGLAALSGLGVFLVSPIVLFTATSVQPDALALSGFAIAWVALLRYAKTGELQSLAVYAVAGAFGMLVKPTMAQLGVASFVYLLLTSPEKLRDVRIWAVWAGMCGLLLAHMRHASSLYDVYGNTFGVFSGGVDAKTPQLEHLLMPRLFLRAANFSRKFGTGSLGAIALVVALVQRKNHAAAFALFASNALWVLSTLRYTSDYAGTHYLLCEAVLVAYAGAQVVANLNATSRMPIFALASVLMAFVLQRSVLFRLWQPTVDQSSAVANAAARELGKVAHAGDLVVVRASWPKYDSFWHTSNNVHDPRVFYSTRTRGWGIGADEAEPAAFDGFRAKGARFYVRLVSGEEEPGIGAWLSKHARVAGTTEFGGRVYAILPHDEHTEPLM
jgi:hypothetical protein